MKHWIALASLALSGTACASGIHIRRSESPGAIAESVSSSSFVGDACYKSEVSGVTLSQDPSWQPDLTNEPQLLAGQAFAAAVAEIHRLWPDRPIPSLEELALSSVGAGRWVYSCRFEGQSAGSRIVVIVRLSGEVVELVEQACQGES